MKKENVEMGQKLNTMRIKMMKAFLISLIFFSSTQSFAGEISSITVRNQKFEVVKTIYDITSLQLFERIWTNKEKFKSSINPKWLFKIDIEGKGYGDRWLYDPLGYVQVLSKAKVPIYKIPDPDSFNALIGVHSQELVPDAEKSAAPHTP